MFVNADVVLRFDAQLLGTGKTRERTGAYFYKYWLSTDFAFRHYQGGVKAGDTQQGVWV